VQFAGRIILPIQEVEMERTGASVTLHVEVFDEQAMWDHAKSVYEQTNISSGFEELCGTREEPDVTECLRMIFDPGESPPGVQINDSSAEIEAAF
jgi:hypothetical protein